MKRLMLAVALAVASVGTGIAAAQTYPSRPIRIVVPVQPGGSADTLARLLAEQIGKAQGATVVIENRPGAGGIIGTEVVARASPDGTTLLIAPSGFLTNPHLRKVNYDPLTSFEPICKLVSAPLVFVVSSTSPFHALTDLIDAARAKPGTVTMAASGPATLFHIAVEMLKRTANVNMTYVPYPGGAPAITALLGNHVTSVFTDYATAGEQMKADRLRALATASRSRIEALPDLPTVAEFGYADYDIDSWLGVVAPARIPGETLTRITAWFTAALQAPEVKAKLAAQGLYPVGACGADFGAVIRKQYADFGRVIREGNIKAE